MPDTDAKWNRLNRQTITCDLCPRLRRHCAAVAQEKRRAYLDWEYWGKPVPNFGDPAAKLLIVGLAPGAHGANRTGRMFTGDRSGDWLYRALHRAGFASQPLSTARDDGLALINCAITAVCHCAPPDNRPTREEIDHCQRWYVSTLELLQPTVMVALGQIAWTAVFRYAQEHGWYDIRPRPKFGHAAEFTFDNDCAMIGSYHPSQQNTFTGRLTEPMLDAVFARAKQLLKKRRRRL